MTCMQTISSLKNCIQNMLIDELQTTFCWFNDVTNRQCAEENILSILEIKIIVKNKKKNKNKHFLFLSIFQLGLLFFSYLILEMGFLISRSTSIIQNVFVFNLDHTITTVSKKTV